MAADFNKPALGSAYTVFPGEVRDNISALAKLDLSSASNIPTGARQLATSSYNRFQTYSGSWADLSGDWKFSNLTLSSGVIYPASGSLKIRSGSSSSVILQLGSDTNHYTFGSGALTFSADNTYEIGSHTARSKGIFSNVFYLYGSLTDRFQWGVSSADTAKFTVASTVTRNTLFENSSTGKHGIEVQGAIINAHKTLTNEFTWSASAGDTAIFTVQSTVNRYTRFENSDTGPHHIAAEGHIKLDHKTFTNNFTWTAQSAGTAEFTVESSVDRYTDFVNSGAGNHNIKMNGTTVSTTFTGVHIYELGAAEEPAVGSPVRLVNKKIYPCELLGDPACVGFFVGSFIEANPEAPDHRVEDSFGNKHTGRLYHVATLGDTVYEDLKGLSVSNENGELEAGDYLMSASKPGFVCKYDPSLPLQAAIAWVPEPVAFDDKGEALNVYAYIVR